METRAVLPPGSTAGRAKGSGGGPGSPRLGAAGAIEPGGQVEADALGEGALFAFGLGFEALAEGLRQAEGDRGHFVVGHATQENAVLQSKQAKNRDLRKNLVVSYSPVMVPACQIHPSGAKARRR